MRSPRSSDGLLAHQLAVLSCHHLYFARLEGNSPHHVIFRTLPEGFALVLLAINGLLANTLALAVHEEFHLVCVVVVAPHVDGLSRNPVPMREEMKHVLLRPLTLIHKISVLRETCQVDDSEVAASCRISIRSRFSYIIETGPDKLSTHEIIMFHHIPSLLVRAAP